MTLPRFTTERIIGPDSEQAFWNDCRHKYLTMLNLVPIKESRNYLERTIDLLEQFDTKLAKGLRNDTSLDPAQQIFHELFEKCSNILDQRWLALWQARIAPKSTWRDEKTRIKAERNVYFPVFETPENLSKAVNNNKKVAAIIQADAQLYQVLIEPQFFVCRWSWLSDLKEIARHKHRGVLSAGKRGPSAGVHAVQRNGEIVVAKMQILTSKSLFKVVLEGSWNDGGTYRPIPIECIWFRYWGELLVGELKHDAQMFVHEIIENTIRLVQRLDAIL
jgi:hypothetical protein